MSFSQFMHKFSNTNSPLIINKNLQKFTKHSYIKLIKKNIVLHHLGWWLPLPFLRFFSPSSLHLSEISLSQSLPPSSITVSLQYFFISPIIQQSLPTFLSFPLSLFLSFSRPLPCPNNTTTYIYTLTDTHTHVLTDTPIPSLHIRTYTLTSTQP